MSQLSNEEIARLCSLITTSVPLWTIREKNTSGKFSANTSGFADMHEALLAIKKFEQEPGALLPGQTELLTSGHLLLEFYSQVAKKNNVSQYPHTVKFDALMERIKSGMYPRINSIIPPVFGYPGAEQGGLISDNPKVRQFAIDLLMEALSYNLQLKKEGLGEGITIIWPAYMSLSAFDCGPDFFISNDILMASDQWQYFRDGIVQALQEVKVETDEQTSIHLEWKVNDPGLIDIIPTLHLAIQMANQINAQVGWKACFINNEWAHCGLAGIPFTEATTRTIDANLFDRLVHVNVGTIHSDSLEERLEDTTENFHPADWPALLDPDWPVGYGSLWLMHEQQFSIALLAHYSTKTGSRVILEHDVFHCPGLVSNGNLYGKPGTIRQPFDVLGPSVFAANKMVINAINNPDIAINYIKALEDALNADPKKFETVN